MDIHSLRIELEKIDENIVWTEILVPKLLSWRQKYQEEIIKTLLSSLTEYKPAKAIGYAYAIELIDKIINMPVEELEKLKKGEKNG